jgi:hypothetical protein
MHEEELAMLALSDWRFVCFKRGRKILGLESLEERRLLTVAPTVTGVYLGSSEWSAAFYDYFNTTDGPDLGFMIPTGSAAQENSLPWLNVNKISIEFSEDVHVQMNDLSLSAINSTSFAFQHFFYDAIENVATWTLAAPLPTDTRLT